MKEGIDTVFKIPRTKILKITFKESAAAKKSTEKGILGLHMSIPPHSIKIEEFTPITTCFKCYAIEDHTTAKCPKPKDYKICSECSSQNHTWKECDVNNKKCVNCDGDHRTIANKCPHRKRAIEEKRQQIKNSNSKSYSSATSRNTNTAPSNFTTTTPIIEKETTTKFMTCMMHAHLINSMNPGSYNDELNRALKLNNLPPVNLPVNPPSKHILNLTSEKQTHSTQENSQNTDSTPSQETLSQPQPIHPKQHISQEELEMPPLEKIQGRAIGFQIITKKSEGWPKETTLTLRNIKEGLDTGLYKFRYTNSTYTEQEIILYLLNNDIDLSNCWCTIEDSQFNKIRNGLHQEHTPPPNKVSKHKHRHRHASK
ncbi:hypothetical protein E2C01_015863 [Portunus trituberculatus]|uniref:Nucleic-acid-binding protein from transposon X-element n=1 Tax=Portunus trituberculatus TaxID=210409 RepID=A0A5B7DPJ0_PORTR|nr:hypothetical protein [Portunus trituberculatus]